MKNVIRMTAMVIMTVGSIISVSCAKDGAIGPAGTAGQAGPAGPAGPEGSAGAIGPQGVSGNANVSLYEYGSVTFNSFQNYLLTDMATARIDSSLVLMYYNPMGEAATAWYPVPGSGPNGVYLTRNFWFQSSTVPQSIYTVGLRTQNFDGSSETNSKTFTKTRIFIAAASQILPGGKGARIKLVDAVDIDDYYEVCDYFGIKPN